MENEALTDWLNRPDGLSTQLRALRDRADRSLRSLAAELEVNGSTISRVERGLIKPSSEMVSRWARACGASQRQTQQLVALAAEAKAVHRSWQRRAVQESYTELAATTTRLRVVEVSVIPGPLQIEGYARARMEQVGRRVRSDLASSELEVQLTEFLKRGRAIHDAERSFEFIIWAPVLRLIYTSAETHRAQLSHLTAVSHLPTVDLAIIPEGILGPPLIGGVSSWDELVIIETMSNEESHLPGSPAASMYMQWMDDLSAVAVRGDDARALIEEAIRYA